MQANSTENILTAGVKGVEVSSSKPPPFLTTDEQTRMEIYYMVWK